jgi:hypothetical protein
MEFQMSSDTSSRTLPRPKAKIDPQQTPFVGNETVEDNLHEAVEVAIWTVLGQGCSPVAVEVRDGGVVALTGTLPSETHRRDLVAAVRALKGVMSVVDHLDIGADETVATPSAKAGDMLYVRRFCAADETSTSAAIRQAIGRLATHFAEQKMAPTTLVVIYRNLRPQTVTLDIAMPVPAGTTMPNAGTLRVARMPASNAFETVAQPGFDGLIEAVTTLKKKAGIRRNDTAAFWQSFDLDQVRPWTGHPQAKVHLAA